MLLTQREKYLKIQRKFTLIETYFSAWQERLEYYRANREDIIRGEEIRGFLVKRRVLESLIAHSEARKLSHAKN